MAKTSLEEEQPAPAFCLSDQGGNKTCLEDLKGKWVVLYFYPKDNTQGCSLEAMDFSRLKGDFEAENTIILGVSRDSEESHRKFIEKKDISICLLSDTGIDIHKTYDVFHMKNFMGKEVMSTVRTTFLIDPEGRIARIWNNVKVRGHAKEVLAELRTLKGQ